MSASCSIITSHCNLGSHRQIFLGQVRFGYSYYEFFQLLDLDQRPDLLESYFAELS